VVLLERNDELTAIGAVVERGGSILIEGGAGIGKTSLLSAACARATDGGKDVLSGRGSELESGFAFGVVLQLFERRVIAAPADERRALLAGPAAAVRHLLTGEADPEAVGDVSFAVFHGLYWLAANVAIRRPLVIAVDDAHWGDLASLRWLAYLSSRLEGLPISLVLTLRPGEALDNPSLLAIRAESAIVRPRLLSEQAAQELVRQVVGARATDELCATAWRKSGGNPFYLREVLRSTDDLTYHARDLSLQVASRVKRLDPRALRLGQALAVLGDGCQLRHAAKIADLDAGSAARLAGALVRLEVLAADAPPRFLHPVLREALEDSLGTGEREAAHLAAAHLLDADGAPAGIVAAHLIRLGPAGDAWVVDRLRAAARAAVENGALRIASDLLARALEEPPRVSDRISVLREAAAANALAGSEAACARLEEALNLAQQSEERAQLGLELAEAHANLYHWPEAVDVCRRALAEPGPIELQLRSRLEAELVLCALRDGRRAALAMPVLESLATRPLTRETAEAYAAARALAALLAHRPAREVAAPLESALEAAGPRVHNWDLRLPAIATLLLAEGFDAVEAALNRMLGDVGRTGSARGLHVTYVCLGLLKLLQGALPEAETAAQIALRVLQAAEFPRGLPLVVQVLSDVAVEAGQLEEAERVIELVPMSAIGPTIAAVPLIAARARLRLAQGRPAEALAETRDRRHLFAVELWGKDLLHSSFYHVRSDSALALLRLGDREGAIEMAEAELVDARAFGASRALGRSLRVAGLAHGGDRGMALLEDSFAVLRDSPAQLERAHSLAALGAARRRAGRRSAAREPLAEALDLAARCGARPLAVRAREELRATGARPRSEWRTGVEALTPSELRVARMAAAGKTNREIAQELFVTLKTVEGHLARAYDKLEIKSRSELRHRLEGEKTRVSTL
jgi:DNA-binding CsgD family transcriptional regulator